METNMDINVKESIIRASLSGVYDIEEFKSFYEDIVNHPSMQSGMCIIWDARNLDVRHVSRTDFKKIGAFVAEQADKRGKGKAAWVVSEEFHFGMARMFELMNEDIVDVAVRAFKNIDEAEQWAKE